MTSVHKQIYTSLSLFFVFFFYSYIFFLHVHLYVKSNFCGFLFLPRSFLENLLFTLFKAATIKTQFSPPVTQKLRFIQSDRHLPSSKHWVRETMASRAPWGEQKTKKTTLKQLQWMWRLGKNVNTWIDVDVAGDAVWQCGLLCSKLLLVWRTPEEVSKQCTTPATLSPTTPPWLLNAKAELCWCRMWI